jgi:hypothetical protein
MPNIGAPQPLPPPRPCGAEADAALVVLLPFLPYPPLAGELELAGAVRMRAFLLLLLSAFSEVRGTHSLTHPLRSPRTIDRKDGITSAIICLFA